MSNYYPGIKFDSIPVATGNPLVITSGWGAREVPGNPQASRFHKGNDIRGATNTPILAVAAGEVLASGIIDMNCGYGVTIRHKEVTGKETFQTTYCHMIAGSQTVRSGDTVTAGQQIGKVGLTGNSKAPHLHLILKTSRLSGDQRIDPRRYIEDVARRTPQGIGADSLPPASPIGAAAPGGASESPVAYGATNIVGRLPNKIAGFESFHPHIQFELTRRRKSSETVNTHMPFVKLTALVKILGENRIDGSDCEVVGYCPTLGVHGNTNVEFTDIYTPRNNRSIIAYATKSEKPSERFAVITDKASIDTDPPNIPPPGIVSMTTERNTAGAMGVRGGLLRANVKIVAYSLGQINGLMKYFLRPATRVALEFGRQTSSEYERTIAQNYERADHSDKIFQKFNWKRPRPEIDEEIEAIIRMYDVNNTKQEEFVRKYNYGNFGNYEIFLGYVANFKLRYGKNNTYEIELQIHSTQQFELPVKLSGARALCGPTSTGTPSDCGTLDIEDFFTPTSGWKSNSFSKLLTNAITPGNPLNTRWGDYVIKLNNVNKQGGTSDDTYLIHWTFFIDVVLNDEVNGIMSIFQLNRDRSTLEVIRSGMPKRIRDGESTLPLEASSDMNLNGYEVSWHKYLRSTDAATMVIDNPTAQAIARNENLLQTLENLGIVDDELKDNIENTEVFDQITTKGAKVGRFEESANSPGLSSLTKGIWLNSNAIIDSFTNADTLTAGLDSLLTKMNNASLGYWNLQIASNDLLNSGVHIVDMGESKPNTQPIQPQTQDRVVTGLIKAFDQELSSFTIPGTDKPQYLYMFNRKLSRFDNDDVGGELIDINVQSDLPHVVAVQVIAGVGGLAQRGTLNAIDINELKNITLYDIYPTCGSGSSGGCSDEVQLAALPATEVISPQDALVIQELWKTAAETGDESAANKKIKEIRSTILDDVRSKNESLKPADRTALVARTRAQIQTEIEKIKDAVVNSAQQQNASYINLLKEYSGLYGQAIEFISYDKTKLTQNLDTDRDTNRPHPFNSSNLTKTIVDLTLPGIGGISLFEAFAVDRIPNILRQGYYIVTKVAHEFSVQSGWVTKIQGRFRYRPIQDEEGTRTLCPDPTGTSPTGDTPPSGTPSTGAPAGQAERITPLLAPVPAAQADNTRVDTGLAGGGGFGGFGGGGGFSGGGAGGRL